MKIEISSRVQVISYSGARFIAQSLGLLYRRDGDRFKLWRRLPEGGGYLTKENEDRFKPELVADLFVDEGRYSECLTLRETPDGPMEFYLKYVNRGWEELVDASDMWRMLQRVAAPDAEIASTDLMGAGGRQRHYAHEHCKALDGITHMGVTFVLNDSMKEK